MKKYTAPQCETIELNAQESLLLTASDNKGNGVWHASKRSNAWDSSNWQAAEAEED